MHTATSKVENLAQVSSCSLKFVHGVLFLCSLCNTQKLLGWNSARSAIVFTTIKVFNAFLLLWRFYDKLQNLFCASTKTKWNANNSMIVGIGLNSFNLKSAHCQCLLSAYLYVFGYVSINKQKIGLWLTLISPTKLSLI